MDTSVNSSSNSSLRPHMDDCSARTASGFIYICWLVAYILCLPVFISVLYIGYKRWRNQRFASMSHSDVFTFHMVAMEIMIIVGSWLYFWGVLAEIRTVVNTGRSMSVMATNGQKFFHVFTCVERYLAVVHPITYRGLKQSGGVRIRNISIGGVWLFSFGLVCAVHFLAANERVHMILDLFWWGLSFALASFCSFSALCVLIHPGPGEVGGDRKQIGQSKRRAFHTMVAVMGTQLMGFTAHMCIGLVIILRIDVGCLIVVFSLWINLPSSLVLPLLFLHRAGKLPGCQHKN